MPERTMEAFDLKGPRPRTIATIVVLLIVFIFIWGAAGRDPEADFGSARDRSSAEDRECKRRS